MEKEFKKDPKFKKAYRKEKLINLAVFSFVTARERKGVIQKELADMLYTKQSAISRFESSKNQKLPSLEFLFNIADVLGR